MSDRYYAKILFPKAALGNRKILGSLPGWGGLEEIEDVNERVACYEDEQARYGAFDDFEDALAEEGYPFDRYSSAYDGGALWRYYRPPENGKPRIDMVLGEETEDILLELFNEQTDKLSDREFRELAKRRLYADAYYDAERRWDPED